MAGLGAAPSAARVLLRGPLVSHALPTALRGMARPAGGWMKRGGAAAWGVGTLAAARPRPLSSMASAEAVVVPKPIPPHAVSSFAEERRRRERLATEYFEYPVTSLVGDDKGTAKLATAVFHEPLRVDILQRVVLWQQAKKRPIAKAVKTRADVRGGGKKPWRQKGTGRARHGSIRSPIWRGGGKAHGPTARSFAFSLPKKVRRMGLRVALSARLREGKLIIVDDLALEVHKTSLLQGVLEKRGIDNAVVICNSMPENFIRACSNLPNIDTLAALGSNVYSILKRRHLIITRSGLDYLHTFLLRL